MPTSDHLAALAIELRHARTRLVPIEIAERIQHTVVRIEAFLATTDGVGASTAHALVLEGQRLLDECAAFFSRL